MSVEGFAITWIWCVCLCGLGDTLSYGGIEMEEKYAQEVVDFLGYDSTLNLVSMTTQNSVIECLRMCLLRDNCVYFSYAADLMLCRLHHSVMTSVTGSVLTQNEWKHYRTVIKTCPEGWRQYSGSCYLFEDILLENWDVAKNHCKSHGAYLAEVESITESLFITNVVSTLNESAIGTGTFHSVWGFWLGGNDIDNEGTWTWSESGNPVQNISWKPMEPYDYGDEDCMIIIEYFHYTWLDYKCDQKENFICEKPLL